MSPLTNVLRTARYLWTHPLSQGDRVSPFVRWLRWQLGSRLLPGAAVVPFVEDARLLAARGEQGATGNIYAGLAEPMEMAFCLCALRPGDLFVDVGANIGSFTVLAGAVAEARVIAFEPIGRTFSRLVDNIRLNRLDARAVAMRVAVGAQRGSVRFTDSLDTTNHVVSDSEGGASAVEVDVVTLDEACAGEKVSLMKIDVEGFEIDALRGATRLLAEHRIEAIIVELNGSGARYGYDDAAVDAILTGAGLTACVYDPSTRNLEPRPFTPAPHNGIYVRDLDEMRARVVASRRFRVGRQSV